MAESRALYLSCEHGGNKVPSAYQSLFQGQGALLNSHRGYDPGALWLAKGLSKGMAAPLEKAETTRLLVDLNRSQRNNSLLSAVTRRLSPEEKSRILEQYYLPYRLAVKRKIETLIQDGMQVVHLSIHSFTPNFDGCERNAELGLLYDPARSAEKQFCRAWQQLLQQQLPGLKIRRNYPYRGNSDGLVRTLRQSFSSPDYLGLELEVNQGLLHGEDQFPASLQHGLLETLREMFPTD